MSSNEIVHVPASDGEIQALKHLTPAELQEAKQLAQALDVRDSLAITSFAVKPQKELAALTDPILKMVTTKDSGVAGQVLTDLLQEIKSLDAGSFASQVESKLSKVPLLGRMFDKLDKFVSQYEKVSVKIDRTVVELEKSKNTLMRDVVMLDKLYEQNSLYFRQLLTYIGAGELKLDALRVEHAGIAEQARASRDPIEAQQVADMGNAIARLERRVHDLKLAAMIALQSAPQIRLVQNSDQSLTEKIQSSILTTIPIWKNQVIIAIALFDQKKATELQGAVARTTNDLLRKNAEMLRQSTTDVARETERGIVEIETLRAVNDQLIATIQETIEIQQEGSRKRKQVETELENLQAALTAKQAEVQRV